MTTITSRLPGESGRAHEAFEHYLRLGPSRSLAKLWAARKGLQPGAKAGAVPGRLKHWSARWHWQERAAQWDDQQDRELREKLAKAQQDAKVRHARLANASLHALSVPAAAVVVLVRDHDAMEAVIAEARASVRGLLRLLWLCIWCARVLPAVVQVERRALGLSDVTIEIEERRVDPVARAIAADPVLTALAVDLIDQISRRNQGVAA